MRCSPATTSVLVRRGRANDFAVSGPIPATHALTAVWSIDGAPVAVGPQFSTNGQGIALGGHTLSVVVSDATPFVRNDPSGVLRATRSWSITVTPGQTPPLDFDGNGREELAVFRQSSGQMFVHGGATTSWGIPGDVPVPGDYAGDGTIDLAVWRPSSGTWYVPNSAPIVWGEPGDQPVAADYDGNGTTDIAVWRPSTGEWFVRGYAPVVWGQAGDMPVPADYDGNGTAELAVWRPSSGVWYVKDVATELWGMPGDIPVPADYDGNGTADIAVFRRSTATWYVRSQFAEVWGLPGDLPVPLDRSGDGRVELAVYRPSTGTWHIRNRATNTSEQIVWGAPGDRPVGVRMPVLFRNPTDFDGDGRADLTIFRPSSRTWFTDRSPVPVHSPAPYGGAIRPTCWCLGIMTAMAVPIGRSSIPPTGRGRSRGQLPGHSPWSGASTKIGLRPRTMMAMA